MGGRGKRRRNIAQKHGGAKDCAGVKGKLQLLPSFLSRIHRGVVVAKVGVFGAKLLKWWAH